MASSWKNPFYQTVIDELNIHFKVLDWRKYGKGFTWDQVSIDNNDSVDSIEYRRILYTNPIARAGFNSDFVMMQEAHIGVLLLPCGKSAHLEAGWFWGQNKPLFILTFANEIQPELMYLGAKSLHFSVNSLIDEINSI